MVQEEKGLKGACINMKKQKGQLILVILILIIVSAFYGGLRYYNKNHEETDESITYQVTQDEANAVTEFSIINENGSLLFTKETDSWAENSDKSLSIDSAMIESMIHTAVSISSEDQIVDIQNMSEYGLDNPQIIISYTIGEKETVIKIGDYNDMISKYYICVNDSKSLYTVDSTLQSAFSISLDELKTVEASH